LYKIFIMRTAIVTGAYGAIGIAIAGGFAEAGYAVTMVGRDKAKLEKAASVLAETSGSQNIRIAPVDLGNGDEISNFAENFTGNLHVLVNNAATAPPRRLVTQEGIEMQFGVNVLAYYRMIVHFSPKMPAGADARIVNVASYWAGGLEPKDLEFKRRRYDSDAAYRQSKQADRMLTAAFAERLKPLDIMVNACHPGDVNSKLSNDLGFGGHESPAEGAATPLWVSLSPSVKGITGRYFEQRRETVCPFMADKPSVELLFNLCGAYDDKRKSI
jgi:NAD(P)-dependent dehydrogenase (short-subunit alcohol dehydrogenase family)